MKLKPIKPKRPVKPKIPTPSKQVTETVYLWSIGSLIELSDYEGEDLWDFTHNKYGEIDHCRVEHISISELKKVIMDIELPDTAEESILEENDVEICNSIHYRKSDGHIYLRYKYTLTTKAVEELVASRKRAFEVYEHKKIEYPNLLEMYKKDKLVWDAQEAEKKLKKMKEEIANQSS